jgi:hypothetical protein
VGAGGGGGGGGPPLIGAGAGERPLPRDFPGLYELEFILNIKMRKITTIKEIMTTSLRFILF